MIDLQMEQTQRTYIFVDNQSAISIASDPLFHGKIKHFNIKFFFSREVHRDGEVQLICCSTEHQNADIVTKSLTKGRFEYLRKRLGICSYYVK